MARARLWMACGLLAGLTAGLLFLMLAVPQYRAAMLVAPTTRSGAPDIGTLFPNNTGVAMEHVLQSFGYRDSSDFMRFETILREATVAGILLRDDKVRQGLAAAHPFRAFSPPVPDTPEKMAAWLQKRLDVESVASTRLKRLVFHHADPAFAVYLLQRLYIETDGLIRRELEDMTEKRIDWLRDRIATTEHPEHQRVLTGLLMDQEQILMILSVNEPFAAAVAEPPVAEPRPAWPRRSLFLAAFMLAGAFGAYVLYGLRRVAGQHGGRQADPNPKGQCDA